MRDGNGLPAPIYLRFSPEADAALREFEKWLEPQLAEGEELSHLAEWANKLAGGIARIAGILHMAEYVETNGNYSVPITLTTVQAAVSIGRDYLLPHALAAFCVIGADPKTDTACCVLDWLTSEYSKYSESAPFIVTRRGIHQGNRRRFKSVDDVDPVLELLVKHGWLRPTGEGKPGRGGFSSPSYFINPAILKHVKKTATRTHCTHCTHSDQSTSDDDTYHAPW